MGRRKREVYKSSHSGRTLALGGGSRKVTVLLNDYVLILVLSLCVYTTVNGMPIKTFIRPNSHSQD